MSVSYMLEDDLLKHLPFSDAAVNLTTTMSGWGKGLSAAYAQLYPKVYKTYQDEQEEYKLSLGKAWIGKEKDDLADLICLPVKTLVKDWGDIDVTKAALEDLGKVSVNYTDIIMPIVITGSLEESLSLLREKLPADPKIHYWVGIATERAKKEELERDKQRVFLTTRNDIKERFSKEDIVRYIGDRLAEKDLSWDTILPVVLQEDPTSILPVENDKPIHHLNYWGHKDYAKRIGHWCDIGIAISDDSDVSIPYNEHIQSLRKAGLGIEFKDIKA